jgi:hypothetical protein
MPAVGKAESSGVPEYQFDKSISKLKSLAGRHLRLVSQGEGKSTLVKADTTFGKFLRKMLGKGNTYADKAEIEKLFRHAATSKRLPDKKIGTLILKTLIPSDVSGQEKFMQQYKIRYGSDFQFLGLDLDTKGAYAFLERAGALTGHTERINAYITTCLCDNNLDDLDPFQESEAVKKAKRSLWVQMSQDKNLSEFEQTSVIMIGLEESTEAEKFDAFLKKGYTYHPKSD